MKSQIWSSHEIPQDNSRVRPVPEKFRPVLNRPYGWHKPTPLTGMWTSTYGNPQDWLSWCLSEGYHHSDKPYAHQSYWLLDVDIDAHIFHVSDRSALVFLLEKYGTDDVDIGFSLSANLNFEKMAEDYDGMHLTTRGLGDCLYSCPSLYGWDCESTLWFKWSFTSVKQLTFEEVDYIYGLSVKGL